MKTIFSIAFIIVHYMTVGQSISMLENKLHWEINQGVTYNLQIIEENIDTIPSELKTLPFNFNGKTISKQPVFKYNKCNITLSPIKKDSFIFSIMSKDYNESYAGIKGLLYKESFSSTGNLKHRSSYDYSDYGFIYTLLIMPVFDYNPESQKMILNLDGFSSYFPFEYHQRFKSENFDSIGNPIANNHISLTSLEDSPKDTIAIFQGHFNEISSGNIYPNPRKTKTDLAIDYNLKLHYSLKDQQIIAIHADIYVISEGTTNTKKKITISIQRE